MFDYNILLLEGFKEGFQVLPADTSIVQAEMSNYFSTTNPISKDKVKSSILEEIKAGNYTISTHKPTIITVLFQCTPQIMMLWG
ncbi:MAG: hypothetical protein AAFQ23_11220 [Cyanobacteria bacterium J06623_1]